MKERLAKFGYVGMTADFLHIGHIEMISQCRKKCGKLIVGIMTDECVTEYKGKAPIMNQQQRSDIVRAIRYVHKVIYQDTFEFPHHVLRLKEFYNDDFIIFDSEEHKRKGADVFIPRLEGISSSQYKEGQK